MIQVLHQRDTQRIKFQFLINFFFKKYISSANLRFDLEHYLISNVSLYYDI